MKTRILFEAAELQDVAKIHFKKKKKKIIFVADFITVHKVGNNRSFSITKIHEEI